MLSNKLVALTLTVLIAVAWLWINDFFAQRGWISSAISRKIIHIGTGPIFVLCWLLFTETPSARWLAAMVPLAITLQFALVGTGDQRFLSRGCHVAHGRPKGDPARTAVLRCGLRCVDLGVLTQFTHWDGRLDALVRW